MMLDRVINAPFNLYFDINPVSRILDHFNIDLKAVDNAFIKTL